MSQRRLRIRVKPGSRRGPAVEDGPDGVLVIHVKARAVGGAANEAALAALAEHLGVRRRDLSIETGHTVRVKTVSITAT